MCSTVVLRLNGFKISLWLQQMLRLLVDAKQPKTGRHAPGSSCCVGSGTTLRHGRDELHYSAQRAKKPNAKCPID